MRMQLVVRACERVFVRLRWPASRGHAKQHLKERLVDVKSNEKGEKGGSEREIRRVGEGNRQALFTYLLRG